MDKHIEALIELNGKFERLIENIQTVREKQEEMADGISKIKEVVYNPDSGIYARLRELESWKNTSSKLIWMVIASMVALGTATWWSQLISN
jgi:hypothetical protein